MDFDPETFMSQTVDAPMAEFRQPVPEGDYQAIIGDEVKFESINFTYKKGPNAGQPGVMYKLTVPWNIIDEGLKARMERDSITIRQQIIVNIDDTGKFAEGDANVQLGQLRAALGQNKPGWSMNQLKGAGPAMVRVRHRIPDQDVPENKFAEVVRVAPIK